MYVPFHEWLERNIDASEGIIFHVLDLCYEIWYIKNKKYFEGDGVVVVIVVQNSQRFIVNFKSVIAVLLETLSGCPNLFVYDFRLTPPFNGCYKFNVDAEVPIKGVNRVSVLW